MLDNLDDPDLFCTVCEELIEIGDEYYNCIECTCVICEECAYALEVNGNCYCPECQPE